MDMQGAGNDISGTLPTEIGWLTGLTYVDLSYNALSKTLPTEVGMLTGLTSIDLGKNSFTGTIPSQIGNCGVPCVPSARSRLTYLNAASPSPGAWTALYSSCESQPPPAAPSPRSTWTPRRSDMLICGTGRSLPWRGRLGYRAESVHRKPPEPNRHVHCFGLLLRYHRQ